MIVEDDSDGDGCSWCPVVAEELGTGGLVSEEHWSKGEEHREQQNWAEAVEAFTRGAVADPRSLVCWIGLSRVSAYFVCRVLLSFLATVYKKRRPDLSVIHH